MPNGTTTETPTLGTPSQSARRSCVYECRVSHHRLWPRRHRFKYRLFFLQLDLDELDALHRSLRLFSHNQRNWFEFRDSDHLQIPQAPAAGLKASLQTWLRNQGISLPQDIRMSLLTLPRVAGYVFNPVSFVFLEDAQNNPLGAIAEVGNTFGELKPYWIPLTEQAGQDGSKALFRSIVPKEFYVSPFTDLEVRFDFRLRLPEERLDIVINDVTADGRTLLHSALVGERHPLNDRQLARLAVMYPLQTVAVIARIHWQALKLWLKRVPWFRKQDNPQLQRHLFRPHASLTSSTASEPRTFPEPAPAAGRFVPSLPVPVGQPVPSPLQPSLPGSLS